MEESLFLAKLIGTFSIVMGVSMMSRRKMLVEIFRELYRSRTLSYILGVAMFLIGLLLVLTHNVWEGPAYAIVITVIGWLVILESVSYLFVPQRLLERLSNWAQYKTLYYGVAFAYLALGGYLVFVSFFSE